MSTWDSAVEKAAKAAARGFIVRQRDVLSQAGDGTIGRWHEYQVVSGNRIFWRAELAEQAAEFIRAAHAKAQEEDAR